MSERSVQVPYLHPLESLTCELQLMLDHLCLERRPRPGWEPACDMYETNDTLVLTVDLPGLTKADVTITLTLSGNGLVLSGRRAATSLPSGSTVFQRERPVGAFERIFILPVPVDMSKSSAQMEAGVLTITLPRRKPVQVAIHTVTEGSSAEGKPATDADTSLEGTGQ
jgi:HSP20 family protein